jgi:hypothetical protein
MKTLAYARARTRTPIIAVLLSLPSGLGAEQQRSSEAFPEDRLQPWLDLFTDSLAQHRGLQPIP